MIRSWHSSSLLGLVAVGVLAWAPRAAAFCRTTTTENFVPTITKPCDDAGQPLSWATRCVGYSVQRSASSQVGLERARQIVAEAFAEWSAHDCLATLGPTCSGAASGKPSMTAQDLGPVDCDAVEYVQGGSNANLVVFRDGDWPHDGVALALTTVTFKLDGGEIYDADVEVQSNPAEVKLAIDDPVPAGAYDLRSILVHEFGHVFGLAHTQPANTTATMFERYRTGQTFMRDVSADDVCGLCNVYPPTRKATCAPTPRGGLGNECGGGEKDKGCGCSTPGAGAGGAASLLLGAGLLAAFARRRRDRAR
ncbi:MAG: matrixin family metalloprotease [Deltaproteobacteria bacterium]|nr:matrixin family metalloprotease [Deltaproteobacteria bacterium]